MRNIVFPALMLISLCFATAALAADQPYAYGGLALGMSSADVTKALGDSTADNTYLDWTVENDLGVLSYDAESGKSVLAMFDQDRAVLLMVLDGMEQEAYNGLFASFKASFGEPGTVPPDFAMKHEIFADFTPEDQAGMDPHFWGVPETQQVLATGYDSEGQGFALLLIDIDDSMKADERIAALTPPEEMPAEPSETAPPAEEAPAPAPAG